MTKVYKINGKEIQFDGGGVMQELLEALSDKEEECHCGKDGHALNSVNCPVHGYYIVPKQSTSLKEDLEYILDTYYSGTRSMDNAREGILKLVQSHLIKEIENECQVYACSRKCGGISPRCILDTDIIKIINNI